ncbi:putative nuclease HARBI1 [Hydra vulgaris]|uniref:putative nuclease HARBI1 n=1 Tax=Hydra vulgaris TaxID=6087 RepID=UPI001F5FA5EE|nr:putative nuclease HARBI1 [Hydra vulgaris]
MLKDDLHHPTQRNKSLSPRDQIKIFLHFLGTASFYHVERDCHGVRKDTSNRAVHAVLDNLFCQREKIIHWPDLVDTLPSKFYTVAQIPSVCGCIDGCHIPIIPPSKDKDAFLNRHQFHSLNVLCVCGPDLYIYYVYADGPGRWHDSRYINNHDNQSAPKRRFNDAYRKTRNVIERCFGVLKNRFYSLQVPIRFSKVENAAKLIVCACMIHNMCLKVGDEGEELPVLPATPFPFQARDETEAEI